jgi:sulfotransferase family protein
MAIPDPPAAPPGWEARLRGMSIPDPPDTPPGCEVGAPDFVGVGAQRAGTTWWWRILIGHPQVGFQRGLHTKEVHFFDELQEVDELDDDAVARYHRWFPRPPGTKLGEWTPRYMFDAATPRHIARAAPDARILILLRDPVDRYASGFARMLVMARKRRENLSEPDLAQDQTERGLYGHQVRRVLDTFPREQVLILQYEMCRVRYEPELRRTYDFLGLDQEVAIPPNTEPEEPREHPLPDADRDRLRRVYAPDVAKLVELVPEIDVGLWPHFREIV